MAVAGVSDNRHAFRGDADAKKRPRRARANMQLWQIISIGLLAVRPISARVDKHIFSQAAHASGLSDKIGKTNSTVFRRSVIIFLNLAFGIAALVYPQEPARVIEIHAKRFSFTPNEVTIRKGEPVRIKLISDDVTHSLKIPALHVNQEVKKDHPAEFTLSSDTVGDFQGKCGHFRGSGHGRMTFAVHVADK